MSKILFVNKDFIQGGGVEKVYENLATQFLKDGHDVSLFIMGTGDVNANVSDAFTIYRGPEKSLIPYVGQLTFLCSLLRKERFDIVIGAKEQANLLTFLCSIFIHSFIPVYTRHCAFDVSGQSLPVPLIICLYNLYALGRGRIVAVAEALAEYIKERIFWGKEQVSYCPNPVIGSNLFELSQETILDLNLPDKFICGVGRLCEQKGFDILLKSYSEALKVDSQIPSLVIIGGGPDYDELKDLSEKLKIKDKVYFTNFISNPYRVMARSSLFVLSSRHEGLPTVLIEALALGVKVLATDCPTGPRQILKDGVLGKLVPVDDIEELSSAIISTLGSESVDSSSVVEEYSHANSAQCYYDVFSF